MSRQLALPKAFDITGDLVLCALLANLQGSVDTTVDGSVKEANLPQES